VKKMKEEPSMKKLYRSPRLLVYGDLRRLTMANKGTTNAESAGGPKTKNSGAA